MRTRPLTSVSFVDGPAHRPARRRSRLSVWLRAIFLLAACLTLMSPGGFALAQPAASTGISAQDWDRALDVIDRSVSGGALSPDQIERSRRVLATIAESANAAAGAAKTQIDQQTQQLNVLGPAPAADQPAEPSDVGHERKDLTDAINQLRARQAHAELTVLRVQQLQASIASLGRERFVEMLSARNPSPVLPATMVAGLGDAWSVAATWATAPLDWYQGLSDADTERTLAWTTAIVVGLLAGVGFGVRRLLSAVLARHATVSQPTYGERLIVAVTSSAAEAAIPLALVAGVAAPLLLTPLTIPEPARAVMLNGAILLATLIVAGAGSRAASLREGTPFRVTPLTPAAANRLSRRAFLVAVIAALDCFVVATAAVGAVPISPACTAVSGFVFAVLAATSLVLLTRPSGWHLVTPESQAAQASLPSLDNDGKGASAEGSRVRVGPTVARLAVILVAVLGAVAAAAGYSRLANYLLVNLQITLLAGFALVALRAFVQQVTQRLILMARTPRHPDSGMVPADAKADGDDGFWLRLVIDPLLLVFAAFLLAPVWQVPREEFVLWLQSLAGGVTILGITLSPMDVVLALMVFALALIVSRALSKALADRILPRTRLDPGVRASIAVGVGHLGSVLAGLLAISVMGISLNNLALVAGALSVGIGFGLQTIVSNFVSGLILLVERPVKVGDYVRVGDSTGFVRRINVRSTELETFERSTIIVPNSDLLSQAVINWTLKDTIGRVDVTVGVAYGSDVQKVQDLLLTCAHNHGEVTNRPAPFVLFRDFGDSALIFELRAFLYDVSRQLRVGSDLRLAIEKCFREAGIEIPFPQREVWHHAYPGVAPQDIVAEPQPATPPPVAAPEPVPLTGIPLTTPAAPLAVAPAPSMGPDG